MGVKDALAEKAESKGSIKLTTAALYPGILR